MSRKLMSFDRAGWRVASLPKRVTSAVGAPDTARGSNLHVRLDVLPCGRDIVRWSQSMLKSPLLLGPVNLPQLVDAGVEGVTAGLNVSSIAEKLGERGRFRLAAEGHGVRAEPGQAAAYATGEQRGPQSKGRTRPSH